MSLFRLRPLALVPVFLASLGATTVKATTVPEMSFDEIVERSAAIVHGKVVRSWTSWDPERTALWTHYQIQVQTRLKGGPGAMLTISEPGGELDGKHMQIAGAPRYEVGEEIVVFASPTPIGYLRTCGWGQGKFEVRPRDGGAAKQVVRASRLGVSLVGGAPGGSTLAASDGSDLSAFLTKVRATLAAQQRRGAK